MSRGMCCGGLPEATLGASGRDRGGTTEQRAGAHDNSSCSTWLIAIRCRSQRKRGRAQQHAAVLLPDERVLMVGGRGISGEPLVLRSAIRSVHTGAARDCVAAAARGPERAHIDPSAFCPGWTRSSGQVWPASEVTCGQAGFVWCERSPVHEQVCVAALPGRERRGACSCERGAGAV